MKNESIEKHKIKITIATSILVLLFVITICFQIATWKTRSETMLEEHLNRIELNKQNCQLIQENVNELSKQANNRDIELAKINTKLSNIETLLLEIKTDFKNQGG